MRGQVLDVDCDDPAQALRLLRALQGIDEVALYGAHIHVVADGIEARRQEIAEMLAEAGVMVRAQAVIPPSLEDVFISSFREGTQNSLEISDLG